MAYMVQTIKTPGKATRAATLAEARRVAKFRANSFQVNVSIYDAQGNRKAVVGPTKKKNPDIITPLKSLIGKTVKIVKQGGRIIGIPVSSNPKRKPARKRNIAGFHDGNGIFHPIRSGTRYGSVKGKRMQWADKSEYVEGTRKKKTVKKKTARKVAKKAVKRAAPRKVAKKKKTATKKRR